MRILAIDPGLHATAAMFCPGSNAGSVWQFLDIPVLEDQRRPNVKVLRDWVNLNEPDRAFIELVGPMPKQGIGSTSVFMRATGHLEGMIDTLGIPMSRITPQRWKKFHKMRTGATKEDSRQLALELVPDLAPWLLRKKDHGRAECALIALYGADRMAPITPPPGG